MPNVAKRRAQNVMHTPLDKEFFLGDMGTCFTEMCGGLRLVDIISRTPSGTFIKVYPISEMASKNGQIVAFCAVS